MLAVERIDVGLPRLEILEVEKAAEIEQEEGGHERHEDCDDRELPLFIPRLLPVARAGAPGVENPDSRVRFRGRL